MYLYLDYNLQKNTFYSPDDIAQFENNSEKDSSRFIRSTQYGKNILMPLAEYFPHHHTRENVVYEYDHVEEVWHFRTSQRK